MRFREFHGSVELPLVGQGTWEIDLAERAHAVAALERGLDAGMTHIGSTARSREAHAGRACRRCEDQGQGAKLLRSAQVPTPSVDPTCPPSNVTR